MPKIHEFEKNIHKVLLDIVEDNLK